MIGMVLIFYNLIFLWFVFFWVIPRRQYFYADVSEHTICSIFIGRWMKCDWRTEMLGYLYRKVLNGNFA